MPQMMPLNWLILSSFLFTLLLLIMIILFFSSEKILLEKNSKKFSNLSFKMLW